MARQNLEPSLKLLFGDEGGYSNRATDSGGPTKYGITHKTLAAHACRRPFVEPSACKPKALPRDTADRCG
nr:MULTISPECIES: glycosyl hydrolase 108 family protein [unclassified Ochrobactrum]